MKYFIAAMTFLFFTTSLLSETLTKTTSSYSTENVDSASFPATTPQKQIHLSTREQTWLKAHKKIRIGTSQYPPLTFVDDSGLLQGISGDYLKLISERTGLVFEPEHLAWPELIESAKKRRIDLFSGLRNSEREKYLNFTNDYLQVSYVVINRQDTPFFNDFSSLNGTKVAVVKNWKVHTLLKKDFPNINIQPFDTVPEALAAVSTMRADAYVGDLLTASFQIHENVLTNLKVAAPAPFPNDSVRFAVRKDWPELATILDKAIHSLSREVRDTVVQKWLQVRFEKGVDWSLVWQWTGGVSFFFLLIIIVTIFWNRRLSLEIKQRQKIESALILATESANQANQTKSTFLANMSHELRTPLNAIMGFSYILNSAKNLTEQQKNQLHSIDTSAQHLLTLICDILDISRIEAGKQEMALESFNLSTLIHEILSIIKVKATEKGLAFIYEINPLLPTIVISDPRRLSQILYNLFSNAIKYTDEGSLTFRVAPLQIIGHRQIIQFEVEDTGIGIPKEKLQEIFKPFTQLLNDRRKTEGSGLGLAISSSLAEMMGGQLSVHSQENSGSTFTLELGLEVVAGNTASIIDEPQKNIVGYEGERKKILIVDDTPTNLDMLLAFLEPLGFELDTAEDGHDLIAIMERNQPQLILMDLLMPIMNGHEALKLIRKNDKLREIKIIGVSAAVADRTKVDAFASDCNDFLSKPVALEKLMGVLKKHLNLEWITEDVEVARDCKNDIKADKQPPKQILDQIIKKAEGGDFKGIDTLLEALSDENEGYSHFCEKIKNYSKRYDDDSIKKHIMS